MRTFCLLAVALWIAVPGLAEARGYMTNEFRTALDRPLKLLLIHPQADFIKAKAVMTEEMLTESHALEDAAVAFLVEELESRGYEITYLPPSELSADRELADLVTEVNDRYDAEWVKIIQKPKKVRHRRYSIGEIAVELGSAYEVDGLLISRIQAVGVTAGKQVLSAFFGGPVSYGRIDLCVIDADDGEVHGYFFAAAETSLKKLTQKPDAAMAKITRNALKKHPDSEEVLDARKLKKLGLEEEEEDEVDASVISEFEELLAKRAGSTGEAPEGTDVAEEPEK